MNQIGVMQVVLSLRPGGLERVVIDLVNHASDQFRFVICCLEEPGAWADQARAKVVAMGKRPGLNWRLIPRIARLARQENIRIVHTHNAGAHLYGALGGKLAGARVLHTEHGKNVGQETQAYRVNRMAARFTDFTVAVSQKNAEIAVAQEGVKPGKLMVLANGIRVDAFAGIRGELHEELGLPADTKIIGTIGRLVPEKNYPLLLRAFSRLSGNIALVFAGDGPLRKELEAMAPARTFFLGARSDVAELLGSFDVFALSSSTEGMSIALLEAMAAGCPIVVTAVGGNVELIEDGKTGLVVPPDGEAALAGALEKLLADPGQLGKAAQEKVRQFYSVAQMVRGYENLYRKLVA